MDASLITFGADAPNAALTARTMEPDAMIATRLAT
jgi:hypothetical protein